MRFALLIVGLTLMGFMAPALAASPSELYSVPKALAERLDRGGNVEKSLAPPGPNSTIMVNLMLEGPHDNDGDVFFAKVKVTNISEEKAYNVVGLLSGDYPDTWVITPNPSDLMNLGDIEPGESAYLTFLVKRDEHDASLIFWAAGDNTNVANSDVVKAPIHPLIMAGAAISMIGLAVANRRKKQ